MDKFNQSDFTRFKKGFTTALDNLIKMDVLEHYEIKPHKYLNRSEFITNGSILFEPNTKLKKVLEKLRKKPKKGKK